MVSKRCYISATEAIDKFRDGDLSPVELMQAVVDQAEKVQPTVNAFSHTFFDEAMEQAKQAELRYRDGTARPLEGIPVAIKDEVDHKGKPNTNGSLLLKDHVAEQSSVMVQRLLDAGAIVHARSAVPEFCLHSCTWSKLYGVTRNPWSPEHSAGGSSGGSGAALAAGMTTLATGSDIGGSIRVPASHNGVVGFKPPYGRIPDSPLWNLDAYCHNGPMARTVADAALFENVIAGPHESDHVSIYPKLVLPAKYEAIKGMKIAYTIDFGYREIDEDVRNNTLAAVERLRSLGAWVEEVDLNWSPKCDQAALAHLSFGAGNVVRKDLQAKGLAEKADQLTSYISAFFERADNTSMSDFLDGKATEAEMGRDIGKLFSEYDALVCPTLSTAEVKADWDPTITPLTINDKPAYGLLAEMCTHYFNILSRCPVLNVPSGRASNDVPTGLQIVGPTYRDEVPFRIASAYETTYQLFVGDEFPLFG